MKKQSSTQAIWLRSFLLLPLLAILLYSFSTKEIIQKQTLSKENGNELIQEKVTLKMIKEYNVIANKWNDPNVTSFIYIEGEKERALYIYNLMSDSLKRESEPFPIRITQLLQDPQASPSINSPTFPKNVSALIEDIHSKKGVFYYGNEQITYKQALEVSKSKDYKGGIRTNYAKKNPELYLLRSEDSKISSLPTPTAPVAPKVGETPPVPPVPPIPPTSESALDPWKLALEVYEKGGEFYLNDKKVSPNEFKNKIEQIRTVNPNYSINLKKDENNKVRITIQ